VKIVHTLAEIKDSVAALRRSLGKTIGLVPTMGALHEGHLSLIRRARERTDAVVMSIFVNPAQFGPKEDFSKYPRTLDNDCRKAEGAGCDIVFAPSAADMYPTPYFTYVNVDELDRALCGASRPGHFRGVATVVLKFFNIVVPDVAFFGAKDAQQVVVLKRMTQDLNVPVAIEVCPTVRENDGLAMSSRNVFLTPAERKAAPAIGRALKAAASLFENGETNAATIAGTLDATLRKEPLIQKEYIEIVDTITLQPQTTITSTGAALVAVACRTRESGTRLIDNIVLGGSL
jgi:pantoate--beta-alanine ligase